MAESVQQQANLLENVISSLNQALPLIATVSRQEEGYQYINQAADILKELPFDDDFKQLSTAIKILTNGGSSVLSSVSYQAFILDLLEFCVKLLNRINDGQIPQSTEAYKHMAVAEYLIRLAGRVTNRYKINVMFEPEYEAKSLRAFMVLKELSGVVRFLAIQPDISENQSVNLDNGLEIDCLSQETPDELHKVAGSVLEVQNVQIFTETRPMPVSILDPPDHPESFDRRLTDYLSK